VTLVKMCGMRSLAEARAALEAGANLVGFIFWKPGKRYVAPAEAAAIIRTLRSEFDGWAAVGVFVDPTIAEVEEADSLCQFDYIQLSGDESEGLVGAMPRPTFKAIHVQPGREADSAKLVETNALGAHTYLLDTHAERLPGGTGVAFDWAPLAGVGPRCFVAGGLHPNNVATALATLTPLGVDVSSGVEFTQGGKDPRLIRAFLEAVRHYDQHSHQ
jgi:phosphoribosylanthranilate isomerase